MSAEVPLGSPVLGLSLTLHEFLNHQCELFENDRFFQEEQYLSSWNPQGQAKHTYLGFLMGFLLIDWGEEFRAKLEDWLFSSELEDTGA